MKDEKFTIKKSSLIFYGIVAALFILQFVFLSKLDAEAFGYMLGNIIIYFITPFIFALFFWRISGKNNTSGATAFNITLVITIVVKFLRFVTEITTLGNS